MTAFSEVKLIYTQLLNLEEEFSRMLDDDSIEDIVPMIDYKEKLIKKLINAHKTSSLTEEEQKEFDIAINSIKSKDNENIEILLKKHQETANELQLTKKKLKINFAYGYQSSSGQGKLIDYSE